MGSGDHHPPAAEGHRLHPLNSVEISENGKTIDMIIISVGHKDDEISVNTEKIAGLLSWLLFHLSTRSSGLCS